MELTNEPSFRQRGILQTMTHGERTMTMPTWPVRFDGVPTAVSEENDTKPADSITVEGPEPFPVCVGRQISGQHPDQPESYDDPAIGTILAHAGAQISATEERDARQGEEYDCKSNQGGMGKEGGKPTPTEDGESEISKSRHNGDKR
jgi:hypothetical protein